MVANRHHLNTDSKCFCIDKTIRGNGKKDKEALFLVLAFVDGISDDGGLGLKHSYSFK